MHLPGVNEGVVDARAVRMPERTTRAELVEEGELLVLHRVGVAVSPWVDRTAVGKETGTLPILW